MRTTILSIGVLLFLASPVRAQTADEIIAKYIKAIGGRDKIDAIKTLRKTGKFIGGGGFEAPMVEMNKRPDKVREEFSLQGLTGITAYDGKTGWKIQPWGGKKDPEPLSDEELKGTVQSADMDGPLVDYRQKGHTVEYLGMEPVEGTDSYKLKVTLKDGDIRYYYFDTDYYVPIKIESKQIVRGTEVESETSLGDYKEVDGVYMPFSFESGAKGSQFTSKVTYGTMETNVPMADSLFTEPAVSPVPPSK